MRRGFNNSILKNNTGQFMGICLGADFTSEHEWGIKGIAQMFGFANTIDDMSVFGPKRTTITHVPENLHFFVQGVRPKRSYLIAASYFSKESFEVSKSTRFELDPPKGSNLGTAWDGRSFGICTTGKENHKLLAELYEAFQNKDIVFLFSGKMDNPFARAGLCVVIKSRLDPEIIEDMEKEDAAEFKLQSAANETGIREYLDKLNNQNRGSSSPFSYYSLTPRWLPDDEKMETVYPVIFWFKPKSKNANSGYFTVEEIIAWTEGSGPIVKTEEELA